MRHRRRREATVTDITIFIITISIATAARRAHILRLKNRKCAAGSAPVAAKLPGDSGEADGGGPHL